MVLNSNGTPDTVVSLGNICLKNVNIFKYLGANINVMQPSTGDSEIIPSHSAGMHASSMQKCPASCRIFTSIYVRQHPSSTASFVAVLHILVKTGASLRRLDTTYRTFLRRIVRNGFKQVDRDSNDFRLVMLYIQHVVLVMLVVLSRFNSQTMHHILPECHLNAH